MPVCNICDQLVTHVKSIKNEHGNILEKPNIQLNNNDECVQGEALPTQWICDKCDVSFRNQNLLQIQVGSRAQLQFENEKLRNMINQIHQDDISNQITLDREEIEDSKDLVDTKYDATEEILPPQGFIIYEFGEEQKLNEYILPAKSSPLLPDEKPTQNIVEIKTETDDVDMTLLNEDVSNQNLSQNIHTDVTVAETFCMEEKSEQFNAVAVTINCDNPEAGFGHSCTVVSPSKQHLSQNLTTCSSLRQQNESFMQSEYQTDCKDKNFSEILQTKAQETICKENSIELAVAVPVLDENLEAVEHSNQNQHNEQETSGTEMPYKKINEVYICMLCLPTAGEAQQRSKCQNAIIHHIQKNHFTKYKCTKCGKFLASNYSLQRHYQQKTDCTEMASLYQMHYKKFYKIARAAIALQSEQRQTVGNEIVCHLCTLLLDERPYSAKYQWQINRHLNTAHYAKYKCADSRSVSNVNIQKNCRKLTLSCICQEVWKLNSAVQLPANQTVYKVLKYGSLLTEHDNQQTDEKIVTVGDMPNIKQPRFYRLPYKKVNDLFVCMLCRPSEKPYSNKLQSSLSLHINKVHYGKFKCTICDKVFATKQSLKRHRSVACGRFTTEDNFNPDKDNKKIQKYCANTDAIALTTEQIVSAEPSADNLIYGAEPKTPNNSNGDKNREILTDSSAVASLTLDQIFSDESTTDNIVHKPVDKKAAYDKQTESEKIVTANGTAAIKPYKEVNKLLICTLCLPLTHGKTPFSANCHQIMMRHVNKFHYAKYQCDRCARVLATKANLKRHKKNKSACDTACTPLKYKSNANIASNKLQTNHQRLSSLDNKEVHVKQAAEVETIVVVSVDTKPYEKVNDLFVCVLCPPPLDYKKPFSSKYKSALFRHVNNAHNLKYCQKKSTSIIGRSRQNCAKSGVIIAQENHNSTTSKSNPKCQYCGRLFATMVYLQRHVETCILAKTVFSSASSQ